MKEEKARLESQKVILLTCVIISVMGCVFISKNLYGQIEEKESEWDEVMTLSGHSGSVNSVSFSPDGKMLASGSSSSKIELWVRKEKK